MANLSVCFVCLGNICRSPTAEGVMRHLVEQAGWSARVHIESAGTAAYHVGESPDRRARDAARRRGISLESRAQQFTREDFERFDYVLVMDSENFSALQDRASSTSAREKIAYLRDFDPDSPPESAVPDPYYGGDGGFEHVLDLCEAACRGWLEQVAGLGDETDAEER